jgi:Xaa-Pro aminopeptidase
MTPVSVSAPADCRHLRHERLADLLERRRLDGLVLRRPANFAWLTGAESRVDRALETGVAELLVTADEITVHTTNIESERFRTEQTPWAEVVEHPWHEPRAELPGAIGADIPLPARPT